MMNIGDRVKVTSVLRNKEVIPVGTVGVLLKTPKEETGNASSLDRFYVVVFDDLIRPDGKYHGAFLVDEIEPA
jgi:hypothetical protein